MSHRTRVTYLTQWLQEPPMAGLQGRFIGALRQQDMDVEIVTGPPFELGSNQVRPGQRVVEGFGGPSGESENPPLPVLPWATPPPPRTGCFCTGALLPRRA